MKKVDNGWFVILWQELTQYCGLSVRDLIFLVVSSTGMEQCKCLSTKSTRELKDL